jgi:hypothetical protein
MRTKAKQMRDLAGEGRRHAVWDGNCARGDTTHGADLGLAIDPGGIQAACSGYSDTLRPSANKPC